MERIERRAIVPPELAGVRFDQAAAAVLSEFSRSRLKGWIDAGCLTLAGKAVRARTLVAGGEELVLSAELEPLGAVDPEPIPLEVVHADEALFVIDKPVGLVVHPGAGNRGGTLHSALRHLDPALAALPRAGLVHRLDKETSGLLLVARTPASQKALVAALAARHVRRTYRAVCQTVFTGGGTIDAPVGRHPRERTRMAVTSQGRPAVTHYRVVERFRAHTHAEVTLETGRTHQIRVHFAYIRAPLVGDSVYGGRPRLPRQPSVRLREALQGFGRQALHAHALELAHPTSGAPLSFVSPLPADIEGLLAVLREDAAAGGARG
jgi:23S rRNA pseudouridine1911/1915/1917 synthase